MAVSARLSRATSNELGAEDDGNHFIPFAVSLRWGQAKAPSHLVHTACIDSTRDDMRQNANLSYHSVQGIAELTHGITFDIGVSRASSLGAGRRSNVQVSVRDVQSGT
jgi:hypothetical protein